MKCSDALKGLPDLALGDLDAEPARELAAHLEACPSCRSERDALDRTAAALRAPAPLPPSADRRDAAVAAMVAAHAAPPVRRPYFARWAAAAAVLIALAAAFTTVRPAPAAFSVAGLWGRADVLRPNTGAWKSMGQGDLLRAGDRVIIHSGSQLRLVSPGVEILIDQDSSVDLVSPRRLALDRGRLAASIQGTIEEPLTVFDTGNNFAALKEGRLEASLREATGQVSGSQETREGGVVLPDPKPASVRRLSARVTSGAADLGGSHDQRLRAAAGQEGTFDLGGKPSTQPAADAAPGAWTEPGCYEKLKGGGRR